ncbi:type IV pilin-like G/H family protein [Rippkaea orientalis]|nr:type IV pilin-like G/H family protein [Rippkaea orientalis]
MYVCKGISVEPLLSAINRAQMGYYTENEYFEYLDIEKGLDLPLGASPHYNIRLLSPMNADTIVQPLNPKELRGVMTIAVSNEQGKREGVHTYIGLTLYNPKTRNFEPQICQSI